MVLFFCTVPLSLMKHPSSLLVSLKSPSHWKRTLTGGTVVHSTLLQPLQEQEQKQKQPQQESRQGWIRQYHHHQHVNGLLRSHTTGRSSYDNMFFVGDGIARKWRSTASTEENISSSTTSSTPTSTPTSKSSSSSSSSPSSQIILERIIHPQFTNQQIVKIILNRPKANAMGLMMVQELQEILNQLEEVNKNNSFDNDNNNNKKTINDDNNDNNNDDDCNDTNKQIQLDRCIIITSHSNRVFSAGADLKERATMTQDEAEKFVTTLRNTMERIARLPIPTIAAIEGVAVGGGLELALATDLRIVSEDSTLGLPETSLAIIPGAGGTQRLPRLIGMSKAKELIWTGRKINGKEAYDIGLANQVVSSGTVMDVAIELAWKIASNGPIAIQASKQAMEVGMMMTTAPTTTTTTPNDGGISSSIMDEALEVERQCYAKVLPTKDRLEGLAAFREGRTPQYKGE